MALASRQREPPPPALNKEPFAGPEAPAPGAAASPESACSVLPLLAIHTESGGTRQKGGDPCGAREVAPGRSGSPRRTLGAPKGAHVLEKPSSYSPAPPASTSLPSSQALRSAETAILHPEAGGCRGWRVSAAKPEKEALEGAGSRRPPGGWGLQQALEGPQPPGPAQDQNGCSRRSRASAPRHPPTCPAGPRHGARALCRLASGASWGSNIQTRGSDPETRAGSAR